MEEYPSARRFLDRVARDAVAAGRPICLDSAPLIIALSGHGPVAALVNRLIATPGLAIVLSVVAVSEVVAGPAKQGDRALVDEVLASLRALPRFTILDFDQRHAVEAAFVRAATGLKLPDAAIVASAGLARASALIGNDRRWRHKPLGVPYHHMDDLLALPS